MAGTRGASFDRTRTYRYSLWRAWDVARPRLCFCMLNPSTADHRRDDPTVRRCVAFAHHWGYGSLEVVNLFALRATRPVELTISDDPIGPRNDIAIVRAARRADMVVAAWGNHGALQQRNEQVRGLLCDHAKVVHLGLTNQRQPKHPLYLHSSVEPRPLRHRAELNPITSPSARPTSRC